MKQTINELSKLLRPDNNFTGDYSFYGVVQSAIIDSDNKVTGYNVEVGDSLIEARKLAGADIGDVVLCTTLSNGVTVISGTLDGDKDAVHVGELVEETNNYFWFTPSNTGFGKGAHITQKTQAEVLADPTNAGGNLLASSNGVSVRQGQSEVALFGETVRVGREDDVRIELNNYGMTAISSEGTPYFNINSSGASIVQQVKQPIAIQTFAEDEDASTNWKRSHTWNITDVIPVWDTLSDGESFDCTFWGILHDKEASPVVTPTEKNYFLRTKSFVKGTTKSYDEDINHNLRVQYNATNGTMYMFLSMSGVGPTDYYYLKSLCCQVTLYQNKTAPYYALGANMPDEGKVLGVGFGNGTIPSAYGIAMGKYNEEDSNDDYALIIGNGTDDDNRSNVFTVDWDGNIVTVGQYESLFKVTTVAVETGSINADSYKSAQNYPMTEESGYNAVGIVGWSTSNWRIQPTSHYVVSNTQIYAGFANYKAPPSSGTSSASATITFRVLWLKATSA